METVGELIDFLSQYPRELPVVLSSDAEGNQHSPLSDSYPARYLPDSTYSGEVYPTNEELDAKLADPNSRDGWSEDDRAPEEAISAIVIVPVN